MPPAASSRGSAAGLGMTVGALVVSGLLVNLLLAVAARSVSAPEYAVFSAFWSIALVAGFGVFLPVEQWLAARPGPFDQVARAALSLRGLVVRLAVVEALVLVVVGWTLFHAAGDGAQMAVVLVALVVVSGPQFLVRGILIGASRLDLYGAVLVLDVVVRIVVAVVLSVAGGSTAVPFAWAVVAGIALAHLPVLLVLVVRAGDVTTQPPAGTGRAILLLLAGSLGAQILFNGPALVLTAAAAPSELSEVGSFQAAFQLVRIPLFLAIPMQATLVPVMARLLHGRDAAERRRLVTLFTAGVAASMGAGAIVGAVLGPWLVHLVFGDKYDVPSRVVAVLAAGAAAYLALLVLTQVFVADEQHGIVGLSWAVGVLVAGASSALSHQNPGDAGGAFALGCVAALACALLALVRASRGTAEVPATG